MIVTDTTAAVEFWTFENFADRLPLSRRQWEALDAVPSVRFSPKGRPHYRAAQVDAWIVATMAPLAGDAR